MTRLLIGSAATVLCLSAAVASAQSPVTDAEILRLQDSIYLAERDVADLRGRDATAATDLQRDVDELRDEVIYLKVKLRKEGSVSGREYSDLRHRIDDVRLQARTGATAASRPAQSPATSSSSPPSAAPTPSAGTTPAGTAASDSRSATATTGTASSSSSQARGTSGSTPAANEIPAGTELDVRLQQTLNSGTAQVEQRFEATTILDLTLDGRMLVPAGSLLRGIVSAVEPASRTNRTARLTLSFDQLVIAGQTYEIRGTVTEAIEGEGIKGEAGRIGAGAGVGAIIGGILGGFKGALAGILIGGGGVIAATEGKEVELPQGTVLRVRIDSPVMLDSLRR